MELSRNELLIEPFKSRLAVIMALVTAFLALFASIMGVINENLYRDLLPVKSISEFLVFASVAQDLISIPLSILLAILSLVYLKTKGYKIFITIMGLVGYFFYGYALYTLQGQYTSLYLVYLAIFAISVYSLIFGISAYKNNPDKKLGLPKGLRITIGVFLSTILLVLIPIWIIRMLPDIAKHIPGDTYGVFILDLGIVFPALGIIAALLFLNRPFGIFLAGIALMKAFTICLSVGFGEWYVKLSGNFPPDFGMIVIFSVLTLISLLLGILYLKELNITLTESPANAPSTIFF